MVGGDTPGAARKRAVLDSHHRLFVIRLVGPGIIIIAFAFTPMRYISLMQPSAFSRARPPV